MEFGLPWQVSFCLCAHTYAHMHAHTCLIEIRGGEKGHWNSGGGKWTPVRRNVGGMLYPWTLIIDYLVKLEVSWSKIIQKEILTRASLISHKSQMGGGTRLRMENVWAIYQKSTGPTCVRPWVQWTASYDSLSLAARLSGYPRPHTHGPIEFFL